MRTTFLGNRRTNGVSGQERMAAKMRTRNLDDLATFLPIEGDT
jgi:hypothetical protein